MQSDVPGTFAAHGKAAQQDALVIDIEALLHCRDRFEHIGLPCPMPASSVDAAKQIHLNLPLIGHGCITGRARFQEAVDEFRFRGVILPPVQPDIQARWLRGIVVGGKRDVIRLN